MQISYLELEGAFVLTPRRFGDGRGFFSEVYSALKLREAGFDEVFVQDNHAYSKDKGVIRGLHFQIPPHAQGKLVRVTRGAILDVLVDIRCGSPTFGRHVTVDVSAEAWNQVYVPAGFAHGYCTLMPETEVLYKVTGPYSPTGERGLAFDDPDLGIDWRLDADTAVLSDKDRAHPRLKDLPEYFSY
jgi:dTDP-4-dehydrorhamnose 3,5-epimerase